jgi:hypothetical protein
VPDGARGELRPSSFPSANHWVAPAEEEFGIAGAPVLVRVAFGLLGIAALLIYGLPLYAAVHFLFFSEQDFSTSPARLQWWIVFSGFILSILIYLLCQFLAFQDSGAERDGD